jgi:serine/threonine-protein kinase
LERQRKQSLAQDHTNDVTSHEAHLVELGRELLSSTPAAPSHYPGGDFPEGRLIREGGQGLVFEGVQESLRRRVAIKIPKRGDLESFFREGEILARLEHPNIVPAYHQVIENGQPKLVMRYVEGEPWDVVLGRDVASNGIELPELLHRHLPILMTVCNAVAFAHSKGIAHCDLKPSNVSLGRFGEICVLDWGMAIDFARDGDVRRRGGTAGFMAPEQLSGDTPLGPHTDIYQLGAILSKLLEGLNPDSNNSSVGGDPGTNAVLNLVQLARRSMSPKPDTRPSSVDAFRNEIERYLKGAGNRERSLSLLAEARKLLDGAADYDGFARCEKMLGESLLAWPDNREARIATDLLLQLWAEFSLSQGDLRLARIVARRSSAYADSDLHRRIEQAEHRRLSQRRLLRAFAAVLAV